MSEGGGAVLPQGLWMSMYFAKELEESFSDLQDTLSANLHGEMDETPSGFAYCGCQTCEVRETLYVLVPLIVNAYERGRVRRLPVDSQ